MWSYVKGKERKNENQNVREDKNDCDLAWSQTHNYLHSNLRFTQMQKSMESDRIALIPQSHKLS